MKRVFISGPYTLGDVAQNVKKAMDISNEVIEAGHAPFCAHLTHFLHMNHYQPYETWIKIDLQFLLVCDAVIRISGESKGADFEVEIAKQNNIPIFENIKMLIDYFEK